MITVTESAVKQLQVLLLNSPQNAGKGLRISVEAGGCAGMQYNMALDRQKEGDEIAESDGVRVLVDASSARYLSGSTLEFNDGLTDSGFRIRNPNATRLCGCGASFETAGGAAH